MHVRSACVYARMSEGGRQVDTHTDRCRCRCRCVQTSGCEVSLCDAMRCGVVVKNKKTQVLMSCHVMPPTHAHMLPSATPTPKWPPSSPADRPPVHPSIHPSIQNLLRVRAVLATPQPRHRPESLSTDLASLGACGRAVPCQLLHFGQPAATFARQCTDASTREDCKGRRKWSIQAQHHATTLDPQSLTATRRAKQTHIHTRRP